MVRVILGTLGQRLHRNCREWQIGRLRVTFPIERLRVNDFFPFFAQISSGLAITGFEHIFLVIDANPTVLSQLRLNRQDL